MLDKWVLLAYQSLFDNYYSVDGELYNELKKYYGEKEWQILKKKYIIMHQKNNYMNIIS